MVMTAATKRAGPAAASETGPSAIRSRVVIERPGGIRPARDGRVHLPMDDVSAPADGRRSAAQLARKETASVGIPATPGGPWRTAEQVEIVTLEYVDWFNHRWLYEACG